MSNSNLLWHRQLSVALWAKRHGLSMLFLVTVVGQEVGIFSTGFEWTLFSQFLGDLGNKVLKYTKIWFLKDQYFLFWTSPCTVLPKNYVYIYAKQRHENIDKMSTSFFIFLRTRNFNWCDKSTQKATSILLFSKNNIYIERIFVQMNLAKKAMFYKHIEKHWYKRNRKLWIFFTTFCWNQSNTVEKKWRKKWEKEKQNKRQEELGLDRIWRSWCTDGRNEKDSGKRKKKAAVERNESNCHDSRESHQYGHVIYLDVQPVLKICGLNPSKVIFLKYCT